MAKEHILQLVPVIFGAVMITGCSRSSNENSLISEPEAIEQQPSDAGENMQPDIDLGSKDKLETLTGFWNIADPDVGAESYLQIANTGLGISYLQHPAGENCFYIEPRNFDFISDDTFTMTSPDSGTDSVELEILRENDVLVVQTSTDITVRWPLVTTITSSDLQICDTTI